MADVYSNAWLVLSATIAHGDNEGFLRPILGRSPPRFFCSSGGSWPADMCVQAHDLNAASVGVIEPTHKRAWCFQEMLLARRVVSYETMGLQYHCGKASIHDVQGFTDPYGADAVRQSLSKRIASGRGLAIGEWMSVVGAFTSRQLTFPLDRLPALSGVARVINRERGINYLGGLWEDQLPLALLWQAVQPQDPDLLQRQGFALQQSPSFAWCSTGTEIVQRRIILRTESLRYSIIIKEARCYPIGPDPYGQLSWGFVRLEGTTYEAELTLEADINGQTGWRLAFVDGLMPGKWDGHSFRDQANINRRIFPDAMLVTRRKFSDDSSGLPYLSRSHSPSDFGSRDLRARATLLLVGTIGDYDGGAWIPLNFGTYQFLVLGSWPTYRPGDGTFEQHLPPHQVFYERLGVYSASRAPREAILSYKGSAEALEQVEAARLLPELKPRPPGDRHHLMERTHSQI